MVLKIQQTYFSYFSTDIFDCNQAVKSFEKESLILTTLLCFWNRNHQLWQYRHYFWPEIDDFDNTALTLAQKFAIVTILSRFLNRDHSFSSYGRAFWRLSGQNPQWASSPWPRPSRLAGPGQGPPCEANFFFDTCKKSWAQLTQAWNSWARLSWHLKQVGPNCLRYV